MSIPGSASPLFFQTAAGAAAGVSLQKSVRFNSGDSAYLNRTPSSAGSNTTWTLSTWVKKTGNDNHIFGAGAGNTPGRFGFGFNGSDKIFAFVIASNSTVFSITTDAVFRDPAAWYHLVLIADTGNSTQADRFKIYVNGVLQSVSGTLMPSSQNTFVNTTAAHTFGRRSYTASDYFNGYLASTILVDGTAKDETDFGAFDDNGVWQAAAYSGSFGTNGFHLFDFENESGIGDDSSGNDNDFTVNNITASVPTVASFSSPSWSNPGSYWNVSDQDSNSKYQTATYSGSSQYSNVTSDTLANNTTYHFFLEQYAGSGDYYGGWFFVDGSSAPSNTVPDELGSDTLGLRVGETSAGTHGSYATANGTSNGQNQIDLTSIKANSSTGAVTFTEFVVNTTVDKVWVRAAGATSWIGGGNPATSSSTPSFHLSGASNMRFGYVAYNSGTYAKYKSAAGSPTGIDLLFDVPTNGSTDDDTGAGGEVSGNYATINPLHFNVTNMSLTNGNLNVTRSQTSQGRIAGTIGINSGKYYFEATRTTTSGIGNNVAFGVTDIGSAFGTGQYGGNPTSSGGASQEWVLTDRSTAVNGSTYTNLNSTLGDVTEGDVVQVAVDMTAGKIWFGKNGTFSGTPASGSSAAFSNLSGTVVPLFYVYNGGWAFNAGQRAFAYSAPSNFKALCTTNLPTPTIANGRDHFDTKLYTGNGGSSTITVSGLNFAPNLVWLKGRSDPDKHGLYDTVRGATKLLIPSSANGESTQNGVTAFNSDGFDIGNYAETNGSSRTYVAWAWNVPGSASSNSDGTITSSVTKNADAGISIVTWTGDDSSGTIGHGLGSKPDLIIVKVYGDSSYSDNWPVYSSVFDGTHYAYLNDSRKFTDFAGFWNDGTATSTVFPVGDYNTDNTKSLIGYCFTSVYGFSAFGQYSGDGDASNGNFVHLPFRPAFLLIKDSTSTGYWYITDSGRNPTNDGTTNYVWANTDGSEQSDYVVDLLSNGFRLLASSGNLNASSRDYVYAAFAENPFSSNGGLAR